MQEQNYMSGTGLIFINNKMGDYALLDDEAMLLID